MKFATSLCRLSTRFSGSRTCKCRGCPKATHTGLFRSRRVGLPQGHVIKQVTMAGPASLLSALRVRQGSG